MKAREISDTLASLQDAIESISDPNAAQIISTLLNPQVYHLYQGPLHNDQILHDFCFSSLKSYV